MIPYVIYRAKGVWRVHTRCQTLDEACALSSRLDPTGVNTSCTRRKFMPFRSYGDWEVHELVTPVVSSRSCQFRPGPVYRVPDRRRG